MFLSLYTDKAKGILTEQRFMKLTATLEQEQEANQKRLQDLLLMMRHSDEQVFTICLPLNSKSDSRKMMTKEPTNAIMLVYRYDNLTITFSYWDLLFSFLIEVMK